MAIKPRSVLTKKKRVIDLSGPEGNVYFLLGIAKGFCKQLGKDWEDVRTRMEASDYENLVKVFDQEFGDYVQLYR